MAAGKACFVDAIVQLVVDAGIQVVDLTGQIFGIQAQIRRDHVLERCVEHADDVGAFVVHDHVALGIPQHRHCGAACIVRVSAGIDLVNVFRPKQWVRVCALVATERPALIGQ